MLNHLIITHRKSVTPTIPVLLHQKEILQAEAEVIPVVAAKEEDNLPVSSLPV